LICTRLKNEPAASRRKTVNRITYIGVVALCATFASTAASAQCGASMMRPRIAVARPKVPIGDLPPAVQASTGQGAREVAAEERSIAALTQDAPIVGLWRVTFVSDGQVVDEGFDAWHGDGTETLNDTPPPSTGNVCLGVWVQNGARAFKLKHPSWTFDANGNLNGTAIIREQVTVDTSGASFKGTFTVDVFDVAGNPMLHLDGQITGERITPDSFD
jgi:hypothetical protein